MTTLLRSLQAADERHVAIGHFNVSELVTLKAVVSAAQHVAVPVIIGVSEGERQYLGTREIAAFVAAIRSESSVPVYLNADHTHSLEKTEEAARAGFDLIVFDASELPFEQNAAATRRAVEAAKSIRPEILVEGEIGYIGSGSEIRDQAAKTAPILTTPEEARQFADQTRVDLLAPAVGTTHGMLRSMVAGQSQKHLDIDRIAAIKQSTHLFLTLHGGSGTNDDDFRRAIQAGITVIHINTELRIAWRRGLEAVLRQHPDEVVPYKLLPAAQLEVEEAVERRLRLFNGLAPSRSSASIPA
jgi:fructose-bisphosphate aldolase class II